MPVSIFRPRSLCALSMILATSVWPGLALSATAMACDSGIPCAGQNATSPAQGEGADGLPRHAWIIRFAPGTSELDDEARSTLNALLGCLRSSVLEGAELQVLGFAHRSESVGKVVHALAHDRADAVAWRLRHKGFARVHLRGFEESSSVRAASAARVEILLGVEGDPSPSPLCVP